MNAAASIKSRINEADLISIWGKPDPDVLSAGRRNPPAMPESLFGSGWGLVQSLAADAGAPVDYCGLSVLVAAASLIGGKRRVRPHATSNWTEPCILWAAAVGDPSSNKSPALKVATRALGSIEKDGADVFTAAMRSWEADEERAKASRALWQIVVKEAAKDGMPTPALPHDATPPDVPQRRRAIVNDATPEAIALILSGNPQGTLLLRDELSGWFASFDRYNSGGRPYWLEAYGGDSYVVDRLKSGGSVLKLSFNGVSVIGGIQPDKLVDVALGGGDDGLVSRFLWAWPNPVPYSPPPGLADLDHLQSIYQSLESLNWGSDPEGNRTPIILRLDTEAERIYNAWRSEPVDNDAGGSLYRGAVGKLNGTVLRIALVAEFLRWALEGGAEPEAVSVRSMGAALDYADLYAKPSALRVFGDAALPPAERNAATLARAIVKHKPTRINARSIRRDWRLPGLREAPAVKEAIEVLVDADWLAADQSRDGDTPGRKRADYIINPSVFGRME